MVWNKKKKGKQGRRNAKQPNPIALIPVVARPVAPAAPAAVAPAASAAAPACSLGEGTSSTVGLAGGLAGTPSAGTGTNSEVAHLGSSTPPVGGGTAGSSTVGSTATATAAAIATRGQPISTVGTITTTGSSVPIVTTPSVAHRTVVQGQLERTTAMKKQRLFLELKDPEIARLLTQHELMIQKQNELHKEELDRLQKQHELVMQKKDKLNKQEIDRLDRKLARVKAKNAKKQPQNPHGPHAAAAARLRMKAKMTPPVCGAPPVAPPAERPASGGKRKGEAPAAQQNSSAVAPPIQAAAIRKAPAPAEQRPATGGTSEGSGAPVVSDVGSTEISTSNVVATTLRYNPNAKPDDESTTFSMYGREIPAYIFTQARNRGYGEIINTYGTGIPAGMMEEECSNARAGILSAAWYQRIFVAAYRGCSEISNPFYKQDPKYPESQFSRINAQCSSAFVRIAGTDVAEMYIDNIIAKIMKQLQQQEIKGTDSVSTNKIEQEIPAITANGNQLIVPYSKIDGPVAGDGNMATASINTTDPRNDDATDEEKKPAAQPEYTTDNHEIVRPSVVVSPLATILASEQRLKEIFKSHDYHLGFDAVMDMCISAESMIMLIANESDDSCAHGSSHGQYHMSRALEFLMLLSEGNGYDGPVALTTALAQQAGITLDDASCDPKFAQFLVSTVTNFLPIKSDHEGDHFVPNLMGKAVEIKHRLELNNALISNSEELHVGLHHLNGHLLLKDKRDVVSERRVINVCYRETKEICDCMKQLRLACKTGKYRPCFGCRKLFPKMELLYCAGCGLAEYCSFECSKKDWVEGKHKYVCAKKDYTRCNTCRVIFPSDEQAVHTCITGHDLTTHHFNLATNYATTIKERFTDEPEKYKTFLEILRAREQLGHTEVIKEVSVLLEEHPDLLNEFTFFLPYAVQSDAKEQLKIFAMEAEERLTRK